MDDDDDDDVTLINRLRILANLSYMEDEIRTPKKCAMLQ
jgi:hypothetical protein